MERLRYDTARNELLSFVPAPARRLLDIGCGVARYAEQLAHIHPDLEIWAVEPDPLNAAAARKHVAHLVEAPFPDAAERLPQAAFDVVTYNDVLEHLVDPAAALEATKPLLAAEGVVIASIPNVRHRSVVWPLLTRGRWDYADTGPLDRTHLRFFTRTSMAALFTDSGWRVESVVGVNQLWNWWDGVPGRRVAMAKRLLGTRANDFLYLQYVVTARPA